MKFPLSLGGLFPLLLSQCTTCPADFRAVQAPAPILRAAQVNELSDCQVRHYGTTLLAHAPDLAVAEALLARGALPNGKIIENQTVHEGTALLYTRDNATIIALSRAGADVNRLSGSERHTPLCNAAAEGDLSRLNTLLAIGADPNRMDSRAASPLYLAAQSRHAGACQQLLRRGANPDIGSMEEGASPLIGALRSGAPQGTLGAIVTELLTAGANPQLADATGRTPLHYAPAELVPTLTAAGASVHARDLEGRTPLFYCTTPAQAEALLNAGADINATDYRGHTPFDIVSSPQVKSFLLVRGANSGHPI